MLAGVLVGLACMMKMSPAVLVGAVDRAPSLACGGSGDAAGVRQQDAGRCGFVVVEPGSNGYHPHDALRAPGIVPVSDVLRVSGPHAATILKVIPEAYVAESFEQAVTFSRDVRADRDASRATSSVDRISWPVARRSSREASWPPVARSRNYANASDAIDELLAQLAAEVASLDARIVEATSAIGVLQDEEHVQEKALVAHDAQLARAAEDTLRLSRKSDVVAMERRRAEEERAALETRRADAEISIARLADEQRVIEEELGEAQRRLAAARETVDSLATRAAEARASHAALVERAAAVGAEVLRLEEGGRDLEVRIADAESPSSSRRTAGARR